MISPGNDNGNQIDCITCTVRRISSTRSAATLHAAECGTDHGVLITHVNIRTD